MPCFTAKARARVSSRAATACSVAPATSRAGRTIAAGAMRAAPSTPKRSGDGITAAYGGDAGSASPDAEASLAPRPLRRALGTGPDRVAVAEVVAGRVGAEHEGLLLLVTDGHGAHE